MFVQLKPRLSGEIFYDDTAKDNAIKIRDYNPA